LSPRIWRADRPRWSAPPRCCDWRAQPATPAGAHEITFGDVLTNVRLRVAREYFALEAKPNLSELAHRLGYGEASAASRFLRRHMDSGARALILRGKAIRAQL
jgi:hypothetical protein